MAVHNPPTVRTDPFGNVTTITESGQIAAYKDSRWAGTIQILEGNSNHEDMVRSLCEGVVQSGHIFMIGVQRPFASPQFTKFEQDKANDHLWHFVVMRDYLD